MAAAQGATDGAASLVQSVDWLALAPPALTAAVALIVLVADLFLPGRRKPLLGAVSVAGLAAALLLLLPLRSGDRSTFCLTADPGVCSYTADHFTLAIQLLVLGGALLTALLSVTEVGEAGETGVAAGTAATGAAEAETRAGAGARADAGARAGGTSGTTKLPPGEFWFLLLSSAAGAALLPAARDLATLVVALEVATLPAFALVGLKRGDRLSSEAALKFFLSSVTATAVMLLGVSFVYAATGTLHLTEIADRLDSVPGQLGTLASAGVALTLVGFAFKTAAAPFHFWVPDTYVGAPLPIAAYLSVVGKAVGFSGLILVTVVAFPGHSDVWGPLLAVLAALTMTVGNVAALRQSPTRAYSAVRLLAWSSVAQAGYLLVPIAAAAYAGTDRIGSTVAYALMYAVVNLGAFAVAAVVARTKPLNRLADYRGLASRRPLTALALGFFLLCLAGLPPGVIGLFAKVTVFSSAVDAGLGWLAVVMAVNVVVALFYYLRWTATLFQAPETPGAARAADAPAPAGPLAVRPAPAPVLAAVALTAAAAVALSGAPQLVLRLATESLF
ncbi:NADH-quinone oxidoreductase subunit N [Streptomyces sp. NBC_01498]|uniref:NADH-quinone oxidoreductase subunit N n=1 Tax=Streptomyces sp. NBC_01498 TaxID=2975870 RepID=UPI002E7C3369|nr:NADH-quinone oxidoreductase subunit N [Streptomyces sp. NBC_01498]WTL28797.1 NADH-quinone oxidoreductase subunit N [Streptomyces sp. NBC_01498]